MAEAWLQDLKASERNALERAPSAGVFAHPDDETLLAGALLAARLIRRRNRRALRRSR